MAERRAVIEEELEALAEIEKSSKDEGNDGEGKNETVEIEKQENAGEDNDVDMDEEKQNSHMSISESGDTRQVIIKKENGESMELGE